jgi:CubicO group peptidase (beta-lactamase class C family)
MQKRRIPGLQLAVVRHGRIVLRGAYGLANIQDSVPVTDETLFTLNSITKAFTGVAVMQLVEDGRLDLDAPVSRYLDSLPAAWRVATIRQLLTHTSGLPDIMDSDARMISDAGDDSAWAKVLTLPIESSPGAQFRYNQLNYLLLGRIIDKLSGQPFTRFIESRQFRVVNMPRTARGGFGDSRDVVPRSARGYTYLRRMNGEMRRTETLGNVFEEFPPNLRTAAGLSSTATEIARWLIALQQHRLLRQPASLTMLFTPAKLNDGSHAGFSDLLNGYALGWPTVTRPDHPAAAAVGGGRSAVFVYSKDDLAIVVLTNLQGASPESFIDEIAAFYLPSMRAAATAN